MLVGGLVHALACIPPLVALWGAPLPGVSGFGSPRFRAFLWKMLKVAAIVLLPAAGLLVALAEPVVSVLFRHGEFDVTAAGRSAVTLQMLVPFMLTLAGINIVKKAYFALDDRTTLLIVGALGLVITGTCGYLLSTRIGVEGLGAGLEAFPDAVCYDSFTDGTGMLTGILNLPVLLGVTPAEVSTVISVSSVEYETDVPYVLPSPVISQIPLASIPGNDITFDETTFEHRDDLLVGHVHVQ